MAVMFDLPVGTREERKAATDFRLRLLDHGFEMAQFSVYMRYCVSAHQAETLADRIAKDLPESGKINVIFFTDKQYERILSFRGRSLQQGQKAPPQYQLF